MSTPFAWAIVNSHAAATDPNAQYTGADIVIVAPTTDMDLVRPRMKSGARDYGYMESVMIPSKVGLAPFYEELKGAMEFPNPDVFYCDSTGFPINFGTADWPQARIKPKNKHADWLVDFCSTSGVLRAADGIYLDDFTKQIPKYIIDQLASHGILITKDDQGAHAHYINRLASGLRAKMEPGFKLIANTGDWWPLHAPPFTHPALDAITVEVASDARPNATPRAEAINAAKNQLAHGMQRETSVLWYSESAMPNAMSGIWPNE